MLYLIILNHVTAILNAVIQYVSLENITKTVVTPENILSNKSIL